MAKRKHSKKSIEYYAIIKHRRAMRKAYSKKHAISDVKYSICPTSGKRCFYNRLSAIKELESIKRKPHRKETDFYRCQYCNCYHLTSRGNENENRS